MAGWRKTVFEHKGDIRARLQSKAPTQSDDSKERTGRLGALQRA